MINSNPDHAKETHPLLQALKELFQNKCREIQYCTPTIKCPLSGTFLNQKM